MKNTTVWKALVESAGNGAISFFSKKQEITTFNWFTNINLLVEEKKMATIILWGKRIKKEDEVRPMRIDKEIKRCCLDLIDSADFGKMNLFRIGKDEITLARIFGLSSCVEVKEVYARHDLSILILWGENLSTGPEHLLVGSKVRPLNVPLFSLSGGFNSVRAIQQRDEFTVSGLWWHAGMSEWVISLKEAKGRFPARKFVLA